ncbi:hypothetical protein C4568_03560 [Candidatus Parcubacteria bacterium]|nr:MAG: hypothetical protein C4568_03560 [Candidatus Parcubacteria bacterium]
MRISKAVGVGSVLALATFAPVVPHEMELAYSYQQAYEDQFITSTGTPGSYLDPVRKPVPIFEDTDGNGLISVSVFYDRAGNELFVQIPDRQYAEMGRERGHERNPKRHEFESLLQSLTPAAEAAVALDNTVSAQSVGKVTSLTTAMTVADNTLLIISSFNNDTRTGMTATYDGVSMTNDAQSTGVLPQYIFSLYVTTGKTANIVITVNDAATDVWVRGASWTGLASQAAEASANTTGTGTSATSNLTTTSDDAHVVASLVNENGNAQSMGTNTQDIVATTYVAYSPLASGTAGSKTLTVTWTGSSNWYSAGAAYSLAPASAASSVESDLIIFE